MQKKNKNKIKILIKRDRSVRIVQNKNKTKHVITNICKSHLLKA